VLKRNQTLTFLQYLASFIFCGIVIAGLDVSFETSQIQDAGITIYHDVVDVQVSWLTSQACMALPVTQFLTNCSYLRSIRITEALTVLLIGVLVSYMVLRKKWRAGRGTAEGSGIPHNSNWNRAVPGFLEKRESAKG
jgi:hypothetical protein